MYVGSYIFQFLLHGSFAVLFFWTYYLTSTKQDLPDRKHIFYSL